MADLSTLDPTQPPDTQVVSQGAARIRETRDATITSFDVEHALAGQHSFLNGTRAARPAAGTSGRIYLDTTNNEVNRDSGSAWRKLRCVDTSSINTSTLISLTLPYASIQSAAISPAAGSFIILLGQFEIVGISGTTQVICKLQIDGADVSPERAFQWPGVAGAEVSAFVMGGASVSTEGIHTLDLLAKYTGTAPSVKDCQLIYFNT